MLPSSHSSPGSTRCRRRRAARDAVGRAAVAVDRVAVVALLAGVDVCRCRSARAAARRSSRRRRRCCRRRTPRRRRSCRRRRRLRAVQVREQPSPSTVLPSSHCSPTPLARCRRRSTVSVWQVGEQPSPSSVLPSSHSSPRVDDAVAADAATRSCRSAEQPSPFVGVAVVALLAGLDDAVAARSAATSRQETPSTKFRDRGCDGAAEHEVDVREAAAKQVAVAHDRAAAGGSDSAPL